MNTLIPYHENINTESALKFAADLNLDMEIFHVIRENDPPDLEKKIEEQVNKINGNSKFNITHEEGLIFNALKSRITDFDLIMMVTRTEENIDKTLGSITSHLVDFTSKDVLILPENYTYTPPQNVLIVGEFHIFRHDIVTPKMELLQKHYPDLSFQAMHFTDESEDPEDQLVKIDNTSRYASGQFPEILLNNEISFDQYDIILLAFSPRGIMQNKTFPGNLARKLALQTGKGVWVTHE